MIPGDVWVKFFTPDVIATLPGELAALTADSFSGNVLNDTIAQINAVLQALPLYKEATSALPGWTFNLMITSFSIMREFNGLFLLPIFSAVSQLAMTKLTPQQTPADSSQASTGKFMNWFFPLFSLWLCSSYNGAFALYWVTSNVIAIVQTYAINKYLDKKEQREAEMKREGATR